MFLTKREKIESVTDATDEAVCARAAAGDDAAFRELFERYWRQVFRLTVTITRNESEGEDVAQALFVELYCRLNEYDSSKGSFRKWLLRYAYSRAIDRKRYLATRKYYDHDDLAHHDDLGSDRGLLAMRLSRVEMMQLARQLIEQLNQKQRAVVSAYFFEGQSLQEIAAASHESYGNTRHHLYRGLLHLRELMQAPGSVGEENRGAAALRIADSPELGKPLEEV